MFFRDTDPLGVRLFSNHISLFRAVSFCKFGGLRSSSLRTSPWVLASYSSIRTFNCLANVLQTGRHFCQSVLVDSFCTGFSRRLMAVFLWCKRWLTSNSYKFVTFTCPTQNYNDLADFGCFRVLCNCWVNVVPVKTGGSQFFRVRFFEETHPTKGWLMVESGWIKEWLIR